MMRTSTTTADKSYRKLIKARAALLLSLIVAALLLSACVKEIEFSNQLYYDMQGTMWIPVAAQTKLDLTRKRTIELKNYIANLTIDK